MHGFKSAILAKMKNCTFEPVHEIQNAWKAELEVASFFAV